MRTIDADHLRRWILSRVFKTQLSVADVIDQIDREDTIEPEIVRCKDCRYKELKGVDYFCDHITGEEIMVSPNNYCSWAEKEN